jgi:hypothetical protein
MAEKVKITGCTSDIEGENRRYFDLEVELPLRDLFAAFALNAVIQADFAHAISYPEQAGSDAYRLADAALAARETEGE